MGPQDICARLLKHIGDYLEADVSHLTPSSHLVTALPGIDSLRLQELLLYIEESFGVKFNETVLDHASTLQDLADHIQALLAAKTTS